MKGEWEKGTNPSASTRSCYVEQKQLPRNLPEAPWCSTGKPAALSPKQDNSGRKPSLQMLPKNSDKTSRISLESISGCLLKKMLKKKEKGGGGDKPITCADKTTGGDWQWGLLPEIHSLGSSPVCQAARHSQEPPQPLSNPTLCCTLTDGQNSLVAKRQVNKDHQPFIRLIFCHYKLTCQNHSENEFGIAPFL